MLIDRPSHPLVERMHPAYRQWFAGARHKAMKFSLTDPVIDEIAGLIRETPSLILRNMQFALPPYPECYIELDYFRMVPQLGGRVQDTNPETADNQLGFYIKNNVITVYCARGCDRDASISPYCYVLPQGGVAPPATYVPYYDRESRLVHLLGTTYHHEKSGLNREISDWLLSTQYRVEKNIVGALNQQRFMDFIVMPTVGEFRVAMAVLLWLGQRSHYEMSPVPASRGGLLRGKPQVYSAHHVVRLKQDAKRSRKAIMRTLTERAGPRRHEVQSYWGNRHLAEGCEHDFPLWPDENGHFQCQRCDGIRWRVEKYLRGDASRGFVTKEYRA